MTRGPDRRDEIAAFVAERGHVRVEELVERFGVSRMTIHRHVDQLAQRGILHKLHGAVSAQPSGIYESLFRYRSGMAVHEKAQLAQAALRHIEPGQVVMLDDSTTVTALAPLLAARTPISVVTNSLASADILRGIDGVDLLCPGGQYHRTYDAYIGHLCESALGRLRADVAICSASAVDGATAFIQDSQIVRIKQAMLASARLRILLVDGSKFGRVALHEFAPLDAFDTVIVDAGLPAETVAGLREAGIRIETASSRKSGS